MWNEADHPRASDGRFGHVAGSPRALPTQKVSGTDGGSGSVGAARAKLHPQGAGSEEQRIGNGEKVYSSAYTKINTHRIDAIMDGLLIKPRGLSIEKTEEFLVEMHDDKEYQDLRKKIEDLEQKKEKIKGDIDEAPFSSVDPSVYLSEEDVAQLRVTLASYKSQIDALSVEISELHESRYREMWRALWVESKPSFDESEFDIASDFSDAEKAAISKGIEFMSRIVALDKMPTAKPDLSDLKFRKTTDTRSFYSFMGIKNENVEPNTLALSKQDISVDTVVHEMGHWLTRHYPHMEALIKQHYEARTENEVEEHLKKSADDDYEFHEMYKEDGFLTDYMGKVVRKADGSISGQNELLSVAIENFVIAPDLLAKNDPITFRFVSAILKGETPKTDPTSYQSDRWTFGNGKYQWKINDQN